MGAVYSLPSLALIEELIPGTEKINNLGNSWLPVD